MIRPLRVAHRIAWAVLAVALPTVIAAALLARPAAPPQSLLPAIVGTKQLSRAGTFCVRRDGNTLLISVAGTFDHPDVLAYWSPDAQTISEQSKLLGPFNAGSVNRYQIESPTGNVVLYTPAKRTVIDSAPLGGSQ